jgi:hypothetical protein
MPEYMLIAHSPAETPADFEVTPEMIQAVIEKYNAWAEKLERQGRLKGINKLRDGEGKVVRGFGDKLVVTDGPYAETKEVIGGYWIVEAASYDEVVEIARDCPQLEFGGSIEVREVEDLSKLGAA